MPFDSGNLPPGVQAAMRRAPVIAEKGADATCREPSHTTHPSHCNAAPTSHPEARPIVSFFVAGHPEPAGSKSSFVPTHPVTKEPYRGPGGRIIVNTVDANPDAKKWQKLVAYVARMHYHDAPAEGPLECRFEFIVLRPQGHFGTGRNVGTIKDSAPAFPTVKPDTLKLSRGTEDALTGIIWKDDAQVVTQTATKRYGSVEGVNITVWHATVISAGSPTYEQLKLQPQEPEPEEELPLPGL